MTNLTKPRKLLNPELSNEIQSTQMKALDEYFLMVVFTLMLNGVYVFVNCIFNLNRETWQLGLPVLNIDLTKTTAAKLAQTHQK